MCSSDLGLLRVVGTGHDLEDKLRLEYEELLKRIEDLRDILAKVERRIQIIVDEMLELKNKFGDSRRTEIVYSGEEMNPEDFYADDQMIITISHEGYIKRTADPDADSSEDSIE